MDQFAGKIAVITGGGTGMGRELARQLAAEGCHVAMCDVFEETMAQTKALCERDAPVGTRISTFVADVSDEKQVLAFRKAVGEDLDTLHINLLFNNAGIGGAGSLIRDDREEWDKTFGVCWFGVYHCTRAFLPLLLASSEGHLINTSSVNGFWASLGPLTAHTSYSAAKFAVKGFTEALINDFRLHDIDADGNACLPVDQPIPDNLGTVILQSIVHDHRFILRQPEQSRFRITDRRINRNGSHLGVAEPE